MVLELPSQRAFVVQFAAENDAADVEPRGRVEHVRTGHSAQFGSLDEFWTFVVATLGADESGANPLSAENSTCEK